jgi:hypothetical protein
MKVYANEVYVKRRATIGKWASFLGLAVLAGGFLVSLSIPELFFVSFGTLIVGFLLSNVGVYYANRYMHEGRPDAVLAQALKGFDSRYGLYQFLLPVPQVLREPGGLTVFVLKHQDGQILFENGKWRNKQGWIRLLRWVGQEGIGRPESEMENDIQALREWLKSQAPDLEVPVRGVIVFTHPKAELALDDPPAPALTAKQLKGWLRKAGKLPPFPKETLDRLAQVLNQAAKVGEDED